MQEEGSANDGEAWSCIDEGRWKEGGNRTKGGGELMVVWVQREKSGMQMRDGRSAVESGF